MQIGRTQWTFPTKGGPWLLGSKSWAELSHRKFVGPKAYVPAFYIFFLFIIDLSIVFYSIGVVLMANEVHMQITSDTQKDQEIYKWKLKKINKHA